MMGHVNCVDLLCISGCDYSIPNLDGSTCLHLACLNDKKAIVKMFLEGTDDWDAMDDFDMEDEFGRTSLHAAASVANIDVGFCCFSFSFFFIFLCWTC